ncbi:tetratricopeptide repeat protein [Cyanobium sp. LEGE 06113]|nr:tetratricopeptide repeat protein [Cyanobium sp. LEGE 06113]MBE9153318.1 tetratricopeptide repeat protein [Cyanobium sp. LEGE 06113]
MGSPAAVAQESGSSNAPQQTSGDNKPAGSNNIPVLSDAEVQAKIAEAAELSKAGRYAEAAAIWEQLLADAEDTFRPDHPHSARSLNDLTLLYYNQGLYSKAEPLFKRSLMIKEQAVGPDHPATAIALRSLGYGYMNQGHYGKSEPPYKHTLTVSEKTLGPNHPKPRSRNKKWRLPTTGGMATDSQPVHADDYKISKENENAYGRMVARVEDLVVAGNYVEAIAQLKAYATNSRSPKFMALAMLDVASLQLALGLHEDAEAAYRETIQHYPVSHPSDKEMKIRLCTALGSRT